MKLFYSISVPANGSVELIIPIGVKSCKMRAHNNVTVEDVGVCATTGVNTLPDIKFPIIDGKSPCKFKITQGSGSTTTTFFY